MKLGIFVGDARLSTITRDGKKFKAIKNFFPKFEEKVVFYKWQKLTRGPSKGNFMSVMTMAPFDLEMTEPNDKRLFLNLANVIKRCNDNCGVVLIINGKGKNIHIGALSYFK